MFNPFEDTSSDNIENDNPFEFGTPTPTPTPPVQEQVNNTMQIPTANTHQSNYTKKYNIVDLYWLINVKLFNNIKLNENEAQLLVIGFNADFNNLRFALFEASNATFTENSILKHEAKMITSVNVFSETAQQILIALASPSPNPVEISNFERIFSNTMTSDWKPNTSAFVINSATKSITLKTKYNNKIFTYTFTDWQIQALLNCMKFATNGDSWKASLSI